MSVEMMIEAMSDEHIGLLIEDMDANLWEESVAYWDEEQELLAGETQAAERAEGWEREATRMGVGGPACELARSQARGHLKSIARRVLADGPIHPADVHPYVLGWMCLVGATTDGHETRCPIGAHALILSALGGLEIEDRPVRLAPEMAERAGELERLRAAILSHVKRS